jgi:aminoglycoside phosphotransferase family enzyme
VAGGSCVLYDTAEYRGIASRIDTHSAAVYLAGGRAFKVKRAVRSAAGA